jgi:hypothetical protein
MAVFIQWRPATIAAHMIKRQMNVWSLRPAFRYYSPIGEKAENEFATERKNFFGDLALFSKLREYQKQERFMRRDRSLTIDTKVSDNSQPFFTLHER